MSDPPDLKRAKSGASGYSFEDDDDDDEDFGGVSQVAVVCEAAQIFSSLDELAREQERLVAEAVECTGVSADDAFLLLRSHSWEVAAFNEAFFEDADASRRRAGVSEAAEPRRPAASSSPLCGICFCGDGESVLPCQSRPLLVKGTPTPHPLYCRACWSQYAHHAVQEGKACLDLRCPTPGCNEAVRPAVIRGLLGGYGKRCLRIQHEFLGDMTLGICMLKLVMGMSAFEHFCGLSAVAFAAMVGPAPIAPETQCMAHDQYDGDSVPSNWAYTDMAREPLHPSRGAAAPADLSPAPGRGGAAPARQPRDLRDSAAKPGNSETGSSSVLTLGGNPLVGECVIIASELQGSLRDGTHTLSDYLQRLLSDRCLQASPSSATPSSWAGVGDTALSPTPPAPAPDPEPPPSGDAGPNRTGRPEKLAGEKVTTDPADPLGGSVFGSGLFSGLLRSFATAVVALALELCADVCVHLGLAARAASPPNPLATGGAASDIVWHGPRAALPWSADYMRLDVKARGGQRLPRDLLIAHFVSENRDQVARLRHDTLKDDRKVHLCASDPCADEGCCQVHSFVSSASIPGTHSAQAKRLANGNVLSRCFYLTHILTWAGGVVAGSWHRRSCRRRKSMPLRPVPGQPAAQSRSRDPDSETESEEGMTSCEADLIAMSISGETVLLSPEVCRERATSALTPLLMEDACLSDTRSMHLEGGYRFFPACAARQATYDSQAAKRRCAVDGCLQASDTTVGGVRRCWVCSKPDGVKWAVPEVTPRTAGTSGFKEVSKPSRAPPHSAPSSRSSAPTGRRDSVGSSGSKDVCLGFGDASCVMNPDVAVWVRRGKSQGREESYYSFIGLLIGNASDSDTSEVRFGVSVPDLGINFSIPVVKGLSRNRDAEPLPVVEISDLANYGPDGFECHRSARRDPSDHPAATDGEADTSEPPTPRSARERDAPSEAVLQRAAAALIHRKAGQGVAISPYLKEVLRILLGPISEAELRDHPSWSALDAMCADDGEHGRRRPTSYPDRDVPEPRVRQMSKCSFCHMDPPDHLGRDCPYNPRSMVSAAPGVPPLAAPGIPALAPAQAASPVAGFFRLLAPNRSISPSVQPAFSLNAPSPTKPFHAGGCTDTFPKEGAVAKALVLRVVVFHGRVSSDVAPHLSTETCPRTFFRPGCFRRSRRDGRQGGAAEKVNLEERSLTPSAVLALSPDSAPPARLHHAGGYTDPREPSSADATTAALAAIAPLMPESGGRDAFMALRQAAAHARPRMNLIRFPVDINNRMAYGLASLSFGGRDHRSNPDHSSGARDFSSTSEEAFDAYIPPSDNELERPPRAPTALTTWFLHATRMSWAIACFVGEDWYPIWEGAACYLMQKSEKREHEYPLDVIMGIWGELCSRWCEELREALRDLIRAMQQESPSFNSLKFFCRTLDNGGLQKLQFPTVFNLKDPNAYFATDILARHHRMLTRTCWRDTKPRRLEARATEKGLGSPSSPKEGEQCRWSHSSLGKLDRLDYSDRLQILRRKGVSTAIKLTVTEAAASMLKLRTAQSAKAAQNRQDGLNLKAGAAAQPDGSAVAATAATKAGAAAEAKRKAKQGKRSASRKKILETPLTGMNLSLDQLQQWPGLDFPQDVHHRQGKPRPLLGIPNAKPAARFQREKEIENRTELAGLAPERIDLVAVWHRTRILRVVKEGKSFIRKLVYELLEHAVEFGCPDICADATVALEGLQSKAGQSPAKPGPRTCPFRGQPLAHYRHPLRSFSAGRFSSQPAYSTPASLSVLLSTKDVQTLVLAIRRGLTDYALRAEASLGPAPTHLTQAEPDLRVFCHVAVRRDHDKDFRCFAAFPLPEVKRATLNVLRVGFGGKAIVESVVGWHRAADQNQIWLLIHQGHMRGLGPGLASCRQGPCLPSLPVSPHPQRLRSGMAYGSFGSAPLVGEKDGHSALLPEERRNLPPTHTQPTFAVLRYEGAEQVDQLPATALHKGEVCPISGIRDQFLNHRWLAGARTGNPRTGGPPGSTLRARLVTEEATSTYSNVCTYSSVFEQDYSGKALAEGIQLGNQLIQLAGGWESAAGHLGANLNPILSLRTGGGTALEAVVSLVHLGSPQHATRQVLTIAKDPSKILGRGLPSAFKPIGSVAVGPPEYQVSDLVRGIPTLTLGAAALGPNACYLATDGRIRFVLSYESCCVKGGSTTLLQRTPQAGTSEQEAIWWALRAADPSLDQVYSAWALHTLDQVLRPDSEASGKAGVCSLPYDDQAWIYFQKWLEAWRQSPSRPGPIYAALARIEDPSASPPEAPTPTDVLAVVSDAQILAKASKAGGEVPESARHSFRSRGPTGIDPLHWCAKVSLETRAAIPDAGLRANASKAGMRHRDSRRLGRPPFSAADSLSHELSKRLRHELGAIARTKTAGLQVLTPAVLVKAVDTNPQKTVRAAYALASATRANATDRVAMRFTRSECPDLLAHGTSLEHLGGILEHGLLAGGTQGLSWMFTWCVGLCLAHSGRVYLAPSVPLSAIQFIMDMAGGGITPAGPVPAAWRRILYSRRGHSALSGGHSGEAAPLARDPLPRASTASSSSSQPPLPSEPRPAYLTAMLANRPPPPLLPQAYRAAAAGEAFANASSPPARQVRLVSPAPSSASSSPSAPEDEPLLPDPPLEPRTHAARASSGPGHATWVEAAAAVSKGPPSRRKRLKSPGSPAPAREVRRRSASSSSHPELEPEDPPPREAPLALDADMPSAADAFPAGSEDAMSEGTVQPSPQSSDAADSDVESVMTVPESELEEIEVLRLASSLQSLRRSKVASLGPEDRLFAPLLEALDLHWQSHRATIAAVLVQNYIPNSLCELVSDPGRFREVRDEVLFPSASFGTRAAKGAAAGPASQAATGSDPNSSGTDLLGEPGDYALPLVFGGAGAEANLGFWPSSIGWLEDALCAFWALRPTTTLTWHAHGTGDGLPYKPDATWDGSNWHVAQMSKIDFYRGTPNDDWGNSPYAPLLLAMPRVVAGTASSVIVSANAFGTWIEAIIRSRPHGSCPGCERRWAPPSESALEDSTPRPALVRPSGSIHPSPCPPSLTAGALDALSAALEIKSEVPDSPSEAAPPLLKPRALPAPSAGTAEVLDPGRDQGFSLQGIKSPATALGPGDAPATPLWHFDLRQLGMAQGMSKALAEKRKKEPHPLLRHLWTSPRDAPPPPLPRGTWSPVADAQRMAALQATVNRDFQENLFKEWTLADRSRTEAQAWLFLEQAQPGATSLPAYSPESSPSGTARDVEGKSSAQKHVTSCPPPSALMFRRWTRLLVLALTGLAQTSSTARVCFFALTVRSGRLVARGLRVCSVGEIPFDLTPQETDSFYQKELEGGEGIFRSLYERMRVLSPVFEVPPPRSRIEEGSKLPDARPRHSGALRRSPEGAARIAEAVLRAMPPIPEEWTSGSESPCSVPDSLRGRPETRTRHCGKGRTSSKRRPTSLTPRDRLEEGEGLVLAGKASRPSTLPGSAKAQALATELIMSWLAGTPRRCYDNQWGWWALFCRAKNLEPLRSVCRDNPREEEDLFLEYIVHCSASVPRAPGTVKLSIAAIRNRHVSSGLPDPLTFMPRVPLALEGYKRMYGTKERRRPVTVSMLKWIGAGLQRNTQPDHTVLWAAILLGFFFLLRVSELLPPEASSLPPKRGIRGCDLEGRLDGQPCSDFSAADELILAIRGSKTDKYNRGEAKNHFRVKDDLCVVTAVAQVQKFFPERFQGEEWLLAWDDNRPIRRMDLQREIARAAEAHGGSAHHVGSHSLRFGGASALWAAFRGSGLVKRWGKIASVQPCFRGGRLRPSFESTGRGVSTWPGRKGGKIAFVQPCFRGGRLRTSFESTGRGQSCGRAACEPSGGARGSEVSCLCGTRWCFGCGADAHLPVSCDTVKKWEDKNKDSAGDASWIKAHAKLCPKCDNPIEKNGGCMHMTCQKPGGCGHEFCWICMREWKGHTTCNAIDSAISLAKERAQDRVCYFLVLGCLKHHPSRKVSISYLCCFTWYKWFEPCRILRSTSCCATRISSNATSRTTLCCSWFYVCLLLVLLLVVFYLHYVCICV
ncbi:unnamed protein product [Polarella glacialis]|uniref:RING-type domain-containing protein n=1 Tax=Polarella glacialis TaxID=89957 RepID=A0A813L840_POLGL|nr:unnamed protein product [Polarella glacialis]